MTQKTATVGQSIHIKGEMNGKEDLTIEGTVEGRVSLPGNSLTIGANGRVAAEIHAKNVEVLGQVQGNIVAVDVVTIAPSGSVQGDIKSPRVAIADGARFRGAVDMDPGAKKAERPQQDTGATTQQVPAAVATAS